MRNTIKKHDDFLHSPDESCGRCYAFVVRVRPMRYAGDPQFGVVATKRTFKHAVDRNRAKRRLRAWMMMCENLMLKNVDYIFVARPQILTISHLDGYTAMKKAIYYANKPFRPIKTAKKRGKKRVQNVTSD